ncbi:MAG TPA: hypothetical protein VFN61_05850 [Acidimicrobiales bacterium]|nr:hypothetical protein [Acidimicrobiales bacterium]
MTNNEKLLGRYRSFDSLKLGRLLAEIAEDAKSLDDVDRAAIREGARRLASVGRTSQPSGTPVAAGPQVAPQPGR